MTTLAASALPLPLLRQGKVREVYAVDADRVLLVASDRVSAFDVIMHETVPWKGAVLTQVTAWWLRQLGDEVAHHLLASDGDAIVHAVPALADFRDMLVGRAMLCRRTDVFPVECVVRGYLSGSAWKEYHEHGTLAGETLPAGLTESDRFEPPVFSPATALFGACGLALGGRARSSGRLFGNGFGGLGAEGEHTGDDGGDRSRRRRGARATQPAGLLARPRHRGRAWDHHCGHQVRVRARPRWRDPPDR